MFLKNEKYLLKILIIVFYLFAFEARSASDDKAEVLNYLSSLSDFSASFIQSDGENLSEGKVYIGKKRVRAEYSLPTKNQYLNFAHALHLLLKLCNHLKVDLC